MSGPGPTAVGMGPPPGHSPQASFLALGLAVLCYGVGALLQAMAARRGADRRMLVLHPLTLAGLGLGIVGFVCTLVALGNLPLFLVESGTCLSLSLTAVLALVVLRERPTRRETTAILLISIGVLALSVAAHLGPSKPPPPQLRFALLIALPLIILSGCVACRRQGRIRGMVLAVLAGLSYSGAGLGARALSGHHESPLRQSDLVVVVLAMALTGVAFVTAAMRRLPVNTVTSVLFATNTACPAAVGLLALGDRIAQGRSGFAVAGFVLLFYGTAQLSRQPVVEQAADAVFPLGITHAAIPDPRHAPALDQRHPAAPDQRHGAHPDWRPVSSAAS